MKAGEFPCQLISAFSVSSAMLFMLFTFYEAINLNSLKPTQYLVILPLISSRAERTCYLYEAVSPEFWVLGQRFFFSMHSANGEYYTYYRSIQSKWPELFILTSLLLSKPFYSQLKLWTKQMKGRNTSYHFTNYRCEPVCISVSY